MVPPKRYSKQRAAVLEAVQESDPHPTAEMIYETVRNQIHNISLGTVYRNLNVLSEEGKIREVVFNDNTKRYEECSEDHYHCICSECGVIKDIPIPSAEFISPVTHQIEGFTVSSHRLELYGLCTDCQK